MKQIKFFVTAFVCLFSLSLISCAADRPISIEKLPDAAKTFVKKTFPDKAIAFAEKEHSKYEVHLNDGTEISFDKKGVWEKVDCNRTPVPKSLIPAPIADYVKANFKGQTITKIEKKRYGYDIELSSDLDLRFNKEGKFIGMDD